MMMGMAEYPITLKSARDIVIMRVENGWLIREHGDGASRGIVTPLKVAETPETLIELVKAWADQHREPDHG
jgi:hypothetical protein